MTPAGFKPKTTEVVLCSVVEVSKNVLKSNLISGLETSHCCKQILVGIQDLLDQPNPADPAQTEGYQLFIQEPAEYRRVSQQAKQYLPIL